MSSPASERNVLSSQSSRKGTVLSNSDEESMDSVDETSLPIEVRKAIFGRELTQQFHLDTPGRSEDSFTNEEWKEYRTWTSKRYDELFPEVPRRPITGHWGPLVLRDESSTV